MEKLMKKMATEIISMCAEKYGFSVEEALSSLELVKIKGKKGKSSSVKKVRLEKCKFPLPFSGEADTGKCSALRHNCGLYTQCISDKMVDSEYCKRCTQLSVKSETGIPEYGTIEMRLSCGIQEYVDPKGRKPGAYAKIMKKYNLSREQVEEEASRHGITVSDVHFEVAEESKRGRPATKPKEIKAAKGTKGRPKKAEKETKLAEESDDLFATLLAEANKVENESIPENESRARAYTLPSEETVERERSGMENEDENCDEESDVSSEEGDVSSEESVVSSEEGDLSLELSNLSLENSDKTRAKDVAIFQQLTKVERAKAKATEKAEKEQAKATEKAKKEQAKAAEKAEKEQAKATEKAKKEQAKAAEKAKTEDPTREMIENALTETATIDKTKVQKKMKEHVQKIIQEANEEKAKAQEPPKETYKKFTGPDGKKYLRSSESNNVYDYEVYASSQELEQVGKWDPNTKTAIFNVDESEPELSDEEFDEDD
jgi:hypothetical protein